MMVGSSSRLDLRELLPCGLQWRGLVKVFRKENPNSTGWISALPAKVIVGLPEKPKRPEPRK
jgi:hypothetical protein